MQFLPLTQISQATLRTQDKPPPSKEGAGPGCALLERQRWEDQEFKIILAEKEFKASLSRMRACLQKTR